MLRWQIHLWHAMKIFLQLWLVIWQKWGKKGVKLPQNEINHCYLLTARYLSLKLVQVTYMRRADVLKLSLSGKFSVLFKLWRHAWGERALKLIKNSKWILTTTARISLNPRELLSFMARNILVATAWENGRLSSNNGGKYWGRKGPKMDKIAIFWPQQLAYLWIPESWYHLWQGTY